MGVAFAGDIVSVGVTAFDEDHQFLLAMLKGLNDGLLANASSETLGQELDRLVTATRDHFREEEWQFAKTGYPAAEAHAREHEDLLRQIVAVDAKYKAGVHGLLTLEFMTYLYTWLVHHIAHADCEYTAHFAAHGLR